MYNFTENNNAIKLVRKIKDDSFDVDMMHQYTLSMQVSSDFFRFCVVDSVRNRCMQVEDFSFARSLPESELADALETIFEEHHVLQAGFWKSVRVTIKNLKFSLVPNALFDESFLPKYLGLNSTYTHNDKIYYFKHGSNDAVNVFAAEGKLVDWFRKKYPQKHVDILHHTSLMIEGALHNQQLKNEKLVYVNVEPKFITVIVKKKGALQFCNNFSYQTPNDFLYYVLLVYQQLSLNPEQVPIVLAGAIQRNSELYLRVHKYIRHVHFGKKPSFMTFGYQFDEINEHEYFELYSSYLC